MDKKNIKNLLVIIGGRLGDTIFCTPMLRLLRKIFGNAQINIIATTDATHAILHKNPNIDNIFLKPDKTLLDEIRKDNDLVLCPYDHHGASECAESLGCAFISVPKNFSPKAHYAERFVRYFAELWNFDLAGFDFSYEIQFSDDDLISAKNLLKKYNVDPAKETLIGFHLGCHRLAFLEKRFWHLSHHKKIWPVKKFAKLAKKIELNFPNAHIIVTGAGNEKRMAKKFAKKYKKATLLLNETTLTELMALMALLKLYITCDTGPLHLACGVNLDNISLFGHTKAWKTGPFPVTKNRAYIQKDNIQDITVDEVFELVKKFLSPT